jgi:hypothetical protein
MGVRLSVIITAKDKQDPKLKDLIWSIRQQSFKNYEIIVETEGDSESAKGIALLKAKGSIVCILASDNYLNDTKLFEKAIYQFNNYDIVGVFPYRYFYYKDDNILNRYFALFGFNDPIPWYLEKVDKISYFKENNFDEECFIFNLKKVLTLGDNGMFVRRNILMKADLKHYFHIDVFKDLFDLGYKRYSVLNTSIWHRTGGNIFSFFVKRFKYADKFATKYRRWHMVERKDLPNLLWFILCTITLIQPLYLSVKGYKTIKDKAWFLHPIVCWLTLITYGIWILKRLIKSIFR